MKRKLTDQERLELEASKSMSPRAHIEWLAIALDFTRGIERAAKKRNKSEQDS